MPTLMAALQAKERPEAEQPEVTVTVCLHDARTCSLPLITGLPATWMSANRQILSSLTA